MTPAPDDWRRERRDARRRASRRRRTTALVVVGAAALAVGVGVAVERVVDHGAGPQRAAAGTAATGTGTLARARTVPVRRAAAVPPPAPENAERLALPAGAAGAQVTVPVLMYHRVAPAATATNAVSRDLTVTPEAFRDQMAWLAAHGYTPISQGRLFKAMYRGASLPRRPVVLTFDDGYVDAVDAVLPVLAPRRWPATFFIITSRIGERAFLTWPQLERLDRAGMDIGSHTADHLELPSLAPSDRARELDASRATLQRGLGHPVYWFCYPAGRYDDASAQAVGAAGYLLAYTTEPGSELRPGAHLLLPRVRVRGEGDLAEFASTVEAASATGS